MLGDLGIAYVPLPWLALSVELKGRLDFHPADERGKDFSGTGDPWLRGRVGFPVGRNVSLGGELGVWFPGNAAPSYSPKATTVDVRGLLSWVNSSGRWTLLGLLGARLDQSANSAPDPMRLRYGDRLALGLSDSHAILVGLGTAYRVAEPVQVFGELSGNWLVGPKAPSFTVSPWRAAVGARYFFAHGLSAELSVIPGLSARPSTSATAPLVPIEPRVTVLAGVRYQRSPAAKPAPVETPTAPEAPASIAAPEPPRRASLTGVLTDPAGNVIPDATVTLRQGDSEREIVTLADGTYTFDDLEPGTATLSVATPGFAPVSWEVEVKAPRTDAGTKTLVAGETTGSLRCLVRSFQSTPLKAQVVVRDARGRRVAAGTTDADGLWETPLPSGAYKVTIQASGYLMRRSDVRVAPSEVAVLNVDLREAK